MKKKISSWYFQYILTTKLTQRILRKVIKIEFEQSPKSIIRNFIV